MLEGICKETETGLTLWMLGSFSCFLSDLLTFSTLTFKKKISQEPHQSVSLDPDQDRQKVSPDLGPNCLERLSADDKSCI